MARGALRELRRLSLDFTDVSDRGLEALVAALQTGPSCPCPRLEALRLRCSLVSNAGAHALIGLVLGLGRGGEGKGNAEEETESGPAMRPARLLALKEVRKGAVLVALEVKARVRDSPSIDDPSAPTLTHATQRLQVDLGSSSVVNSEKLRRLKLRLGRLRPGLAFTYESL